MLETRLDLHSDIFESRILIEGATDYRGRPRESRFRRYFSEEFRISNKIRHIIVEFPVTDNPWMREKLQRDASVPLIAELDPDAFIFSSDLDELLNPESVSKIKDGTKGGPVSIHSEVYCNSINSGYQPDEVWCHPKAFLRSWLPESLSALRLSACPIIEYGGWHLSFFLSDEELLNKYNASAHVFDSETKPGHPTAEDYIKQIKQAKSVEHPDNLPEVITKRWN